MIRSFNKKIWMVGENNHLKTVDNYYKIDFMSLSLEHQWAVMKDYCKGNRPKYRTGEEILRKLK